MASPASIRDVPPPFFELVVFWLHEVGESLGLLVSVMVVAVVVVVLRSDVFHLVDTAAFWASLDGALAGHLEGSSQSWIPKMAVLGNSREVETYTEPDHRVRVGRVAGAASVLLVTSRSHHDRVIERSFP